MGRAADPWRAAETGLRVSSRGRGYEEPQIKSSNRLPCPNSPAETEAGAVANRSIA
jgi:hypothetical protein